MCIRDLGTAIPFRCNDKFDAVGILSSPRCGEIRLKVFNISVH